MRNYLQHKLCPLHVYSRLRDHGVPKDDARWLCRLYEVYLYLVFFPHKDKERSR